MKKTFILFILSILMFIGVGASAFILDGFQSFFDYEIDTLTDYIVTFDYNDGYSNDYIYHLESEEGTIDLTNIPKPTNEKNHYFVGWYTTKTGFNEDGTSSKYNGEIISANSRIYAKYVNNENSIMSQNLLNTVTITPSLLSTNSNRYYISAYNSSNEISSTMYIKDSGKILVNYADNNGEYQDNTQGTDPNFKFISKSKVIAILDSDLVIDGGEVKVSSVLGGNTGNKIQALISDDSYCALDLNGYHIIIRNGGKLSGYSIIFNSKDTGGIICENGTIYTPYLVYGYRGGSGTGFYWANGIATFDQFLCPYLSAETIFTKNSELIGQTSLYTGKTALTSAQENITTINLISNKSSSLIQINDGYVIRRQTPYQSIFDDDILYLKEIDFYTYLDISYREQLIFTNNCTKSVKAINYYMLDVYHSNRCDINLNSLDLKVDVGISLNASMKYVDFPIPSFMDIYLYNTDFKFAFSIMFMPGSSLYVDQDSVIYMKYDTSGSYNLYAKIFAYNCFPYSTKYKLSTTYYGYPDKSNPALFYSDELFDCRVGANINIKGNIIFDTSCTVDFSSYYKFYSIGGFINISDNGISNILKNNNIVKTQSMMGYYHFSSARATLGSNYYMDLTYYCSLPLISNEKAYIQTSDGGAIIECNNYDINNLVYYKDSKTYFFRTINDNYANLTSTSTTGLSSYTSEPADLKTKYSNFYGNYQECTQSFLNINNSRMSYISSNGTYFALVNGIYVPLADKPTYNSETQTCSDVNLASSNKFSKANGTISYGTSIYYDNQYLDCWRLNYA